MDEKIKAKELENDFNLVFEKTLTQLKRTYPRVSRVKKDGDLDDNVFKIVLYTILLKSLREVQIDAIGLSINEFHTKYVPNLPILYRGDFTCGEFAKIIEETYLKTRDKQIAYKYFVEKKTPGEIFIEMPEIGDQKTINNNLENINNALLYRACIFNKEKKE
jgi:hypothetical protein